MSHPEPAPPRQVILCDESGRPTGTADLVSAHTGAGQLHLAFSVYVFSPDRRSILVQQRAAGKTLWPLAWANTCCSHPRAGEAPIDAGRRRLMEEMGIACDLAAGPAFVYRAEDPAGRGVEHDQATRGVRHSAAPKKGEGGGLIGGSRRPQSTR